MAPSNANLDASSERLAALAPELTTFESVKQKPRQASITKYATQLGGSLFDGLRTDYYVQNFLQ